MGNNSDKDVSENLSELKIPQGQIYGYDLDEYNPQTYPNLHNILDKYRNRDLLFSKIYTEGKTIYARQYSPPTVRPPCLFPIRQGDVVYRTTFSVSPRKFYLISDNGTVTVFVSVSPEEKKALDDAVILDTKILRIKCIQTIKKCNKLLVGLPTGFTAPSVADAPAKVDDVSSLPEKIEKSTEISTE